MIRRIPMILFVLTILSFAFMIVIRISAMGTRVLTMSSGVGKFVASSYRSSVIIFFIVLILLAAAVMISLRVQKKRREDENIEKDFETGPSAVQIEENT